MSPISQVSPPEGLPTVKGENKGGGQSEKEGESKCACVCVWFPFITV
jgi:hypothetical protein